MKLAQCLQMKIRSCLEELRFKSFRKGWIYNIHYQILFQKIFENDTFIYFPLLDSEHSAIFSSPITPAPQRSPPRCAGPRLPPPDRPGSPLCGDIAGPSQLISANTSHCCTLSSTLKHTGLHSFLSLHTGQRIGESDAKV